MSCEYHSDELNMNFHNEMIDANGGWTVSDAVLAINRMEKYAIAFAEQPVSLDSLRLCTTLQVSQDGYDVFQVQHDAAC